MFNAFGYSPQMTRLPWLARAKRNSMTPGMKMKTEKPASLL